MKEKKCILNLYQSYIDDGNKTEVEAREETGRWLQFGDESIRSMTKEYLHERKVEANKSIPMTSNAHEKLEAEPKDDLRKLIHVHFRKCNIKRMTPQNKDVTYLLLDHFISQ